MTEAFTVDAARSLGGPGWLVDRRVAAAERLASLSWPTPAEEIWRYSRIDQLDLARYRPMTAEELGAPGDERARSDTYPYMEIDEEDVTIGHEATVSKVGSEQLFYLMSRGLTEQQATAMIVNGFIEPIVKTLPMEYAVELSRLIELNMEGAVG